MQPLLLKESWQCENQTENYSHSRCKLICYATTTVAGTWQTQCFIRTMSHVVDL